MNALITDAELIRDARPGQERDGEARRSIHEAMLLFALRRISRDDRDRILTILSFAIPPEPICGWRSETRPLWRPKTSHLYPNIFSSAKALHFMLRVFAEEKICPNLPDTWPPKWSYSRRLRHRSIARMQPLPLFAIPTTMPSPHEPAADDTGIERVVVNIEGIEELTAIRQALDGIREDIDWWLKNHRREQWLPIQPITSMPADPLAPDWAERLNKFTPADLEKNVPSTPVQKNGKPSTAAATAPAEGLDDDIHFCCKSPRLQWTGDPHFPGVACMNCGYIVADCGSVVMHPAPDDDPHPEPKEQQRALFAEE